MEPPIPLNHFLIGAILLLIFAKNSAFAEEDWASKCNKCKCLWSDGKKFANCTYIQLSEIPMDMSPDIRDLDFSSNPLYELKSRAFSNVNLADVHKLKLQNCSIETIHYKAFEDLQLLIDLDLSNNNILKLDKYVFQSTVKLRILSLSYNKMTVLEDNMFSNLSHLQKIFIDNNKLTAINGDLFCIGCPLMHIGLANNKLTTISSQFLDNMQRLSSLDLSGNSWKCDCNLQLFRHQAIDRNLVTITPECSQPDRLLGRKWTDVSAVFACEPVIVIPDRSVELRVDPFSNSTLSCGYDGDPQPRIAWFHNGRIIDLMRNTQKYSISSSNSYPYWQNLSIISVNYRDKGEYKCIATNDAGTTDALITLDIYEYANGIITVSTQSSTFTWIIVLIVLIVIIVTIGMILLLCCYLRRKRRRSHKAMSKGGNMSRSNELMSFDGRSTDDKALITNVNPVSKPPRQYSVPASVTSAATEISEAKKMLIDDESYVGDDESHSLDLDSSTPLPPRPYLPQPHHYPHHHHPYPYPPDLLAAPTLLHTSRPSAAAASQVSPANSYTDGGSVHSYLPMVSPLSPIHHHHHYDGMLRYGTLPYSRSHSPFGGGGGGSVGGGGGGVPVVRVPRHGYVTIPRKPRSSWGSETAGGVPEIAEPLYDNLGLRTTATGSSVLSLNKDPATPRSLRGSSSQGSPNPATTTTAAAAAVPYVQQQPQQPLYGVTPCTPIVEHVSPGRLAGMSTLPRRLPASSIDKMDLSGISPAASSSYSPGINSDRESNTPLLPATEARAKFKIPPPPPPKPKKVTTSAVFEDECEDGTEV